MITLAVDTSEARGSVAICSDGKVLTLRKHDVTEDYSSWLSPAIGAVLREAGVGVSRIQLLAAATGPGSFTGIRVGLTTVKAWAEVHGKPIVGVSRLDAVAHRAGTKLGWVTATYNAQRGQIYAALYRRGEGVFERVGDELVLAPEAFLNFVDERAAAEPVEWASLDPEILSGLEGWKMREKTGDALLPCAGDLAGAIAEIAEARATRKEFTGVLQLDANYVRRSDAEIFWKEIPSRAKG